MMKPLEEWICDRCGNPIHGAKQGYLEWIKTGKGVSDFKIVHHGSFSPNQPKSDCYHYTNHRDRQDLHLERVVGTNGLPKLLSFIDIGPYHDPNEEYGPRVASLPEFIDLFRRLTIPYYEEARTYWANADADGFFDGANETWPYLPEICKLLIENYSPTE